MRLRNEKANMGFLCDKEISMKTTTGLSVRNYNIKQKER